MTVDLDLFFSQNQRMTIGAFGANWVPYPLPLGIASNHWIDMKRVHDMGRGKPVYAHFRIATTFAGPAANNLRFIVIVANETNFAGVLANPNQILCRGPDLPTSALVAHTLNGIGNAPTVHGTDIELVIPTLGSRAIPNPDDQGYLYLGLGIEALTPVSDWTGGGIDAWLSPFPSRARPMSHPGA